MTVRNHPETNAAATGDPELVALARHVIDANRYLMLATADQHGVPWASPVWYARVGYREFLWVSHPQARHSRNIGVRPQVGIVIFDSSVPPSAAPAVYISGVADVAAGSDLERNIGIYSRQSQEQGLREWTPADVQAPARPRLYRVVATEQFVLKPGGDARIPVDAESLAGNRR